MLRNTKKVFSLGGALLLGIACVYYIFHIEKSPNKILHREVFVTTAIISYKTIPKTVIAYGKTVSPLSTSVKAQAMGTITSINFTAGDRVKKGDALFTLTTNNGANQLQKLAAQLTLSRQVYERLTRLEKLVPGSVSKVELLKKATQFKQDLSEYQNAQAIHHIVSPINGIISDTTSAVGEFVNVGDTLVKVVSPISLQIVYQLPSRYFDKVKKGQDVLFMPAEGKQHYRVTVSYIAPEIDNSDDTLTLRADFVDSVKLPPNEFGQIIQVTNPNFKALVIPQSLVQSDSQGFYAYFLENHKVAKNYFMVGEVTKSGLIEVRSGLEEGAILITSNPDLIHVNQTVQVLQK